MGAYIVTFRDKKTLLTKESVKLDYDENIVKKTPGVLVLAALEKLTERKVKSLPSLKDSSWSWREI